MKTLQILPSLEVGGVERGVVDLARAVKKRGDDMVVVSSGGTLVGQLHKLGVRHYTLPVHKKSLFSLGLVGRIADIIQREHIDLVHGRSRVPAWIAWLACWKTQVPFVTTCHGYYSAHFLSRVMGWGKRVIVISRVVGRHMIEDFGVSPDRIRLVHRGIDLSQFTYVPEKYAASQKTLRIVNIGRLSPIKGQLEFLRAVHRLRQNIPNIEVLIVGSEGRGRHRYTELLEHTIRQLGLTSCVKMAGLRQDIPDILAEADLLVLATRIPEAFGRVIVEAGAVGTAVISTRVGGVPDIIDHGENGLLVDPGDVDGMADAMKELLSDRAKCRRFSENLRRKVEARFSLDNMVEQTMAVYQEVKKEKKILVIKLGALGDLILAMPSLRMIRKRFPDAFLSLLVDKKKSGVVSACPYLDEIIPVDRELLGHPGYLLRLAKRFRREGYDVSVDFQNSKWTHLFAFLAGIPQRFGFCRGKFGFLLNRQERMPKIPEAPVKNQYRILSRLGVQKFEDRLELWTDAQADARVEDLLQEDSVFAGKRCAGLVLGASPKWETKRWPLEHFTALAVRLRDELDFRVVLIGTADDRDDAARLMKEAGPGILDLTGKTGGRELLSLIKHMDVLVTGDTAPLHVAAAVGTPAVALFGPTDPRRHVPPAERISVLTRHLPCQPCYQGQCRNQEKMACLRRINTAEVLEAVKQLIPKNQPSKILS